MKVNLQNDKLKPRIRLMTYDEFVDCKDRLYVVKENHAYYLAMRPQPLPLRNHPAMYVAIRFLRNFTCTVRKDKEMRVYKILDAGVDQTYPKDKKQWRQYFRRE